MGTRLPAKLWLDNVEDRCMEQIVNLASLPYAFKHIAIMPDAHAGKGMPIGGVLATRGVVVPNAVGVDIGCGMCAMKTSLKAQELERKQITDVMRHIRATVPLGFAHQKNAVDESLLPEADWERLPYLRNKRANILKEIGTLGGGNLEISTDHIKRKILDRTLRSLLPDVNSVLRLLGIEIRQTEIQHTEDKINIQVVHIAVFRNAGAVCFTR